MILTWGSFPNERFKPLDKHSHDHDKTFLGNCNIFLRIFYSFLFSYFIFIKKNVALLIYLMISCSNGVNKLFENQRLMVLKYF